jgi:hypothetical protein
MLYLLLVILALVVQVQFLQLYQLRAVVVAALQERTVATAVLVAARVIVATAVSQFQLKEVLVAVQARLQQEVAVQAKMEMVAVLTAVQAETVQQQALVGHL